jgi:hypothetical protein
MIATRTEFSVVWPVQGVACFRSEESELVMSDVYWHWIVEALWAPGDDGRRLPLVRSEPSR